MPELPPEPTPTIDTIYQSYVTSNGDWRRDHLGASIIGRECCRELWYTFRWATNPMFDGRLLRLFATGHSQESRILKDLKSAGVAVYDVDPDTGEQIHYADFGGHYAGSLDGIGKGFKESPATWHVIECKTMNTRTFNQLKAKGVQSVKFEHYCQCQVYMGWSGLDRAFYIAVCKDTDELYGERIHFNQELFDQLRLKADKIIFADTPPVSNCGGAECKWCNHKQVCQGKRLPEINCRTCAHSDTVIDCGWKCSRTGKELSPLDQRNACQYHIFIPALVPLEQTDADADRGVVMYGDIVNGYDAIRSTELQNAIDKKGGL